MNTLTEEVIGQVRGAWRFRVVAIAVAWVVAIAGWGVVLMLPDRFEARARVYVDTTTALRPLLEGIAVEQNVEAQLNLVRETLLGRPQLARVAAETDLDLGATTPQKQQQLVDELRKDISIEAFTPGTPGQLGADSIYTITYEHPDRDKALAVVRSLLDSLMEDTLGGSRDGTGTAQRFLREQIAEYERRLAASEAALADFKKRNVGLVPGEQGDYFSRLQAEIAEVRRVQSALEVAQRRRTELERQLRGERTFMPGATLDTSPMGARNRGESAASGASDTATRLAAAQARLDELLLRFTDKHPDVATTRETIAQLEARQRAEVEALRRGDPAAAAASGLAANPVYQTLQLQLRQTEVEIAALQGELNDHRRAEAELRKLVNTAPEVEAEFARLTRDYDVTKAQYNSLVQRLEKARLSDGAQQTGVVQFEVIDPPTASLEPVSPHRALLLSAVFFLAFGCGLGAAWLLSQLLPVFTSARKLSEVTGLPVLGSVGSVAQAHLTLARRKEVMVLGLWTLGLFAAFAVSLIAAGTWTQLLGSFLA